MHTWANRNSWAAGWALALAAIAAAHADDGMVTTADLLKNPRFKAAYTAALGARAKEPWLAAMSNSAPVGKVAVAGQEFQVATPCKPHDCADHNLLLLYAAGSGAVYGKLYDKGRSTLLGGPDAAMAAELDRLWKKEFRQQ